MIRSEEMYSFDGKFAQCDLIHPRVCMQAMEQAYNDWPGTNTSSTSGSASSSASEGGGSLPASPSSFIFEFIAWGHLLEFLWYVYLLSCARISHTNGSWGPTMRVVDYELW